MSAVSVSFEGPVTRIILSRPEKLNAFNAALVEGISQAVADAEAKGARLIVFQGDGKGFSGGFDLSDIDACSDGDLLLRFVRVEQALQAVYHARAATLALVHGACYGAAADLVAACQWRIASPDARFRMPGSRFGLVLGTRRLAALVGEDRARTLLLREKPFGVEEAVESGFLTEAVDKDTWSLATDRILGQVLALDAGTFAALSSRKRQDTREADLAALVRSATNGSVKERVSAYLSEMAAARTI
ncbi:MAG: enoyl-CoA hydratase/isomerase family protein [Pseudomonadota bacterium]